MKVAIRNALFVSLWAAIAAPVAAQTNFATLATDGAWTWFNDPRALFLNGKLYFGHVRAADSKTVLSVFDPSSGQKTDLWTSGFTQRDDHNNPGLLAKQDGTLLAIYARHGNDQWFAYRRSTSTNPVSPGDWTAQQTIPNSGAGMTYANPFQLSNESGIIYNFCRNTNYNPTLYTSTDGGNNWSPPRHFIRTGAGGTRPYVKYSSDYNQRIDFLYTDGHPRDVATSLYHFYYQDGAFYKTDGELLKDFSSLPIQHDSGERGSVIYQYSNNAQPDPDQWIPFGRAWCWETAWQPNGAPVCVFTVQRDLVTGPTSGIDDRIYYYYARWTGSTWQKRFIAHAGRPLYVAEDDYAGGICIDPQNPNVIYISSNAENPFNLGDITDVPLRANNRYELWRGVTGDGGLSFSWTQITTNSAGDNLRPYVPRRNGGEPCVIWFQGTYSTYTSFACSIVGLFTTDVPAISIPTNASLNIKYIEATPGASGNTVLAADGGTFSPGADRTGTDGLWALRTGLANSGTVFESGGDLTSAGNAMDGNNEDAPRLATSVSGLNPGAAYNVYAYFWSTTDSGDDWRIQAGLTNVPGELSLHTPTNTPPAVAGDFMTAPLLTEGNRVLFQASLGSAVADGAGEITVYVDDDPASRAGIPDGWHFRSWYDGVGCAEVPQISSHPTNVTVSLNGDMLSLSWPAEHRGWVLQSQTNDLAVGISTNWRDITESGSVTAVNHTIQASRATFFRLRSP